MGLANLLQEAAQARTKEEVAPENPFRELGFDQNLPRLGWARSLDREAVKKAIKQAEGALAGKEQFIFVGMGGSANGVKALVEGGGEGKLFVLDSLSSFVWKKLSRKIHNWHTVEVVAISKSGSTAETQYLARSLKNIWGEKWTQHFLWLTDRSAFKKLQQEGWGGAKMLPIQPEGREDIGGRFSSPQTLVFLLPLYILLGRSQTALEDFILTYLETEKLQALALELAEKYRQNQPLFRVNLPQEYTRGFSLWITQLFNESFGSKKDWSVKTLIGAQSKFTDFSQINLIPHKNRFLYLAQNMYFLEYFVAFYSYFQKINFVNQPFVEKYKQAMNDMRGSLDLPPAVDLEGLKEAVAKKIQASQRFIEIVLYFPPPESLKQKLKEILGREFGDKEILIFEGSDWNHHSYQAAFSDRNTLYVFALCAQKAEVPAEFIDVSRRNEELLKKISQATFKTLVHKSIYLQLKEC